MDRLRCMRVFLEVTGSGSFGAAARNLGMSRAAVSKHVARLEAMLGARLLNRTTKQVGLTEAGQVGNWSVETYSIPYCQLLQDVWRTVPVVWEGGRPVLKRPPAEHPCAGSGP